MAASRPRVFTIPPSAPFLPTLARALLDGRLVPGFAPRGDPLVLASSTVFLPTRRAVRALASAILEEAGGEATALPRIIPLGDVDEDALAFAEDTPVSGVPAADPLTRKLVLARLVHAWAALLPAATGDKARLIASSPAAAVALADSLARLFDDLIIAGVSFDDLRKVVPPELDRYWERSFVFLQMAYQGWFAYLAEHGLSDATQRRDELIGREAERAGLTLPSQTDSIDLRLLADEELALAHNYLSVEQVRFGERLKVHDEIQPGCEECAIPALLLQPLVENAVKHGVAGMIEGGAIRLAVSRFDGDVVVEVENAFDADVEPTARLGLGLAHVRLWQTAVPRRPRRRGAARAGDRARGRVVQLV